MGDWGDRPLLRVTGAAISLLSAFQLIQGLETTPARPNAVPTPI